MSLPQGWERESPESFLHESGARISRTTYRGKMAWWFFPVSLDIQAVEYPPTDAGRDEAFETSGKGLPKARAVRSSGKKLKAGSRGGASAEPAQATSTEADPADEEADDESENE